MGATAKKPRFAWVAEEAIFDPELKRSDVFVLTALASFANGNGYCIRSQVKLANELRIARSTLQRAIYRLVEAGWLLITQGQRPDGGKCSNTYRVLRKKRGEEAPSLLGSAPPERKRASFNGHGMPHIQGEHKNRLQKTEKEDDNQLATTAQEPGREAGEDRNRPVRPQSRAQGPDTVHGDNAGVSCPDAEQRYIENAVQALASVGLDLQAGDYHGGTGPLFAWYQAGYDLKQDVLPAVLRVLNKAPSRIWSLKYFNRAVMGAHRARLEAAERCSRDFLNISSFAQRDLDHQAALARALADF